MGENQENFLVRAGNTVPPQNDDFSSFPRELTGLTAVAHDCT
jgi:hypothetical protein